MFSLNNQLQNLERHYIYNPAQNQIINEFDRWVHIGWSDKERGEILKATKSHNKAKTIYTKI